MFQPVRNPFGLWEHFSGYERNSIMTQVDLKWNRNDNHWFRVSAKLIFIPDWCSSSSLSLSGFVCFLLDILLITWRFDSSSHSDSLIFTKDSCLQSSGTTWHHSYESLDFVGPRKSGLQLASEVWYRNDVNNNWTVSIWTRHLIWYPYFSKFNVQC